MVGTSHRAIDVVETGYRLDLDEFTWLAELIALTVPELDLGNGVVANVIDTRTARIRAYGWTNITPGLQALLESVKDAPSVESQNTFRTERRGFLSMTERFPRDPTLHAVWKYGLEPLGYADGVGLMARGTDDALELWAPATTIQRTTPKVRRRWDRIAAHLSAALRLRRAVALPAERADAIIDPSGRIQHVKGEASEHDALAALRRAVLDTEKARGSLRRTNPEAALELWKGLVQGTWSLVDHFDTDGKRFILALPNPIENRDPRALSEREASVVLLAIEHATPKEIAYALGISHSNARAVLATALRKLRIASRAELQRFKLETGDVFELTREHANVTVLALRDLAEDPAALSRLTAAERAIATLAANGYSNYEIARARRSSVRTVANQMQSILRKLRIGSRVELARYVPSE